MTPIFHDAPQFAHPHDSNELLKGIIVSRTLRSSIATVLALFILITISACTSNDESNGSGKVSGTITISAAASLTEVFTQLGNDFKAANPDVTEVKFNFDSSSSLATQITEGAPVDVFASADEANMAKLTEKELTSGDPAIFAKNKMTIAVMIGNPQAIEGIADLASGIMVALCGSDVPCGKYAEQILQNAGITIPEDRVTRGQNVKATLTAVSKGDADAGIVYLTDTVPESVNIDIVDIPDDINLAASYPIVTLKESKNSVTAQAFVDYVMSPAGQETLRKAGFLSPQ